MLGLGSSLATSGGVQGLVPSDISGLDLHLKYNTGIAGASNTTAAGNMSDGEVIHSWADQAENHNAEQGTDNDRPNWVAATNDILFDGDNNHFDLASNVEIDANEDFTVMIRHSFPDFDTGHALIGNAGNEVIKVNNNASVTIKIDDGSVAAVFAEEGGLVFATDVFYIFTLIRSGGSDGYLKAYVNGGAHSDKSWDDAESYQDNPAFTLANIAAAADGGLNPDGNMRDVIVWKTALTAGQRADMYSYINAQ